MEADCCEIFLTLLLILVFYCLSWAYDPDLLEKYFRWADRDVQLQLIDISAKADLWAIRSDSFWSSNPSDLEIIRHRVLGLLHILYITFLWFMWPLFKYLFIPAGLIFGAAWFCVGFFYRK